MKLPITIGIDVGGQEKGFHAVGLQDGLYLDRMASGDLNEVMAWCLKLEASAVAVDSPCRWSTVGRSRKAERDLMAEGISSFSTPTLEVGQGRPFNAWMKNGAALYALLETRFRLFAGESLPGPICLETFPQAVACALAGKVVSAKGKGTIRRALLTGLGIDVTKLPGIDFVDAALCAVAAQAVMKGDFKTYGSPEEGLIVVPGPSFIVSNLELTRSEVGQGSDGLAIKSEQTSLFPTGDAMIRLSHGLSGTAGEYFAAAELSRRGYIATITNKNTEGIDILATRMDSRGRGKTLKFQVKTIQGAKSNWVLNAKSERHYSPDLFYILVRLGNQKHRPDIHIVPSRVLADRIASNHRQWLNGLKANGKARKDTDMRAFADPIGNFKDAWHLLDSADCG